MTQEILIENLRTRARELIGALEGGHQEERLEDYIVRGLIDFDDVSYDEQSGLLYKLAGQVVEHLRKEQQQDDEKVRNILLFYQRTIVDLVYSQMQKHTWEKATSYEATVTPGFSKIRQQAFSAKRDDQMQDL